MKGALKTISIEGFKSIYSLKDFELGHLNVVIGANGAGKSNFVQVFRMNVMKNRGMDNVTVSAILCINPFPTGWFIISMTPAQQLP